MTGAKPPRCAHIHDPENVRRFHAAQGSGVSARKLRGTGLRSVHKDLTERLPHVNPGLYRQVRVLLDLNKAERHIRGGLATRRKYKGIQAGE